MKNPETDSNMRLVGELSIYTAAEQKVKLLEMISENQHSVLDLSGISEIDGAGLQLLIMTKREVDRLNHQVDFINHSVAVIEAIELCQLASLFDDPIILTESAGA